MAGASTDGITVVVARQVTPGREADFQQWVDDLLAAARRCPGFVGSGVLGPIAGGSVWHVVYRFDNAERLAAWEASTHRTQLLERGAEFMTTVAVRRFDGIEAWFSPQTGPSGAPPRWKTFVMTAVVIVLLQFTLSTALHPLVGDWPLLLRTAAVILPLVALMTWVVMPRLSHWLRPWLYGGRPDRRTAERG